MNTRIHDLQQIFRWIVEYKTQHDGNSPSLAEIMAACGISSRGVAFYELRRLQEQGLIRLPSKNSSRGIVVIGGEWRMNGAK